MNQVEFAKRMDVLPQHVTNWKDRGMPPERHEKAAEVLDCSVDYLLGRVEKDTAAPASDLTERERELLAAYRAASPDAKRAIEGAATAGTRSTEDAGRAARNALAPVRKRIDEREIKVRGAITDKPLQRSRKRRKIQ